MATGPKGILNIKHQLTARDFWRRCIKYQTPAHRERLPERWLFIIGSKYKYVQLHIGKCLNVCLHIITYVYIHTYIYKKKDTALSVAEIQQSPRWKKAYLNTATKQLRQDRDGHGI